MIKVEEIFTKHFSDHDRRKAMTLLRPMQQHGNHTTAFFLGESAHCTTSVWLASTMSCMLAQEVCAIVLKD
jgi:hypothetical protein